MEKTAIRVINPFWLVILCIIAGVLFWMGVGYAGYVLFGPTPEEQAYESCLSDATKLHRRADARLRQNPTDTRMHSSFVYQLDQCALIRPIEH